MPISGQDPGGKLNAVRLASFLSKNSVLTWLQLHGEIADQVPAAVVGVVIDSVLDVDRLLVIVDLAARRTGDLHWLLESFRYQRETVVRFFLILIVQSL